MSDSLADLPVIKLSSPRYYLIDSKGKCFDKLYKLARNAEKRIEDILKHQDWRTENANQVYKQYHEEHPDYRNIDDGKDWLQIGEEQVAKIVKCRQYWHTVSVQELK